MLLTESMLWIEFKFSFIYSSFASIQLHRWLGNIKAMPSGNTPKANDAHAHTVFHTAKLFHE